MHNFKATIVKVVNNYADYEVLAEISPSLENYTNEHRYHLIDGDELRAHGGY